MQTQLPLSESKLTVAYFLVLHKNSVRLAPPRIVEIIYNSLKIGKEEKHPHS